MKPRLLSILFALTAALAALVVLPPAAAEAYPPPWETGESRPEDLEVSLVTFGPGDSVVAWFGHTALVVEDTRRDVSRLYNYGMFSFGDGMLVKFAMGRLWFWVGEAPVEPTLDHYKRQGRDVRIAKLNLPPDKRAELAEYLAWNVRPENREYLYHHYFNNCATRIRDIIDDGVGGALAEATKKSTGQTFRDHTRRHAAHNPPMEMLLMFLMNDSIDQPIEFWDDMFLPAELEEHVLAVEYENAAGERVPLVVDTEVYYDADAREVPDEVPVRWPWALPVGVLVGGGALGAGAWYHASRREAATESRAPRVVFGLYNALIGLVVGLPGLALLVMWLGTDHKVTYANENLFLGNPLTFLVLPLGLMLAFGSERARRWLPNLWLVLGALALLLVPLKLLPVFDQDNWLVIAFLLPIILGGVAAWWWPRLRGS